MSRPDAAVPPGARIGTAAELVRWLHEQAEAAETDADRGTPAHDSGERAMHRAYQASLAEHLYAAIACIAVMRPEIPHAGGAPVLDDSERSQVEEARKALAGLTAGRKRWGIYVPWKLDDHVRALLDLLDKIAPKEAGDA